MRTIEDIDVNHKKILLRSDLNVPLTDGHIDDDSRIQACLLTLKYLIERGGIVTVCSHLGRPNGEPEKSLSLRPVSRRLSKILGCDVIQCDDCIGPSIRETISRLAPGDVAVLENTRFHPGETANDAEFAAQLAEPFDLFVNDAFGTVHREHASTEGVTHYLPSVAGLLMATELDAVETLRDNPAQPFMVILGGIKAKTKLPVINSLLKKADSILIGGAIANTFLKASGTDLGASAYEDEFLGMARNILGRDGGRIKLPMDAIVASDIRADAETRTVPIEEIPKDMRKLDIGPATIAMFKDHLKKAKTVVWNGPMGYAEFAAFEGGTRAIAEMVAGINAVKVIAGGDTIAAIRRFNLTKKMTHVSTGGGAFLKLLETGDLPAVLAVDGHGSDE